MINTECQTNIDVMNSLLNKFKIKYKQRGYYFELPGGHFIRYRGEPGWTIDNSNIKYQITKYLSQDWYIYEKGYFTTETDEHIKSSGITKKLKYFQRLEESRERYLLLRRGGLIQDISLFIAKILTKRMKEIPEPGIVIRLKEKI